MISVAISSHYFFGEDKRTAQLEKILRRFPTWAFPSSWVSTYDMYRYWGPADTGENQGLPRPWDIFRRRHWRGPRCHTVNTHPLSVPALPERPSSLCQLAANRKALRRARGELSSPPARHMPPLFSTEISRAFSLLTSSHTLLSLPPSCSAPSVVCTADVDASGWAHSMFVMAFRHFKKVTFLVFLKNLSVSVQKAHHSLWSLQRMWLKTVNENCKNAFFLALYSDLAFMCKEKQIFFNQKSQIQLKKSKNKDIPAIRRYFLSLSGCLGGEQNYFPSRWLFLELFLKNGVSSNTSYSHLVPKNYLEAKNCKQIYIPIYKYKLFSIWDI